MKLKIFTDIKLSWKETIANDKFYLAKLFSAIAIFTVVVFFLTKSLDYYEARSGFSFNDPLLNLFQPINLTWPTFIIIYISLFGGLFTQFKYPKQMLIMFQTFALGASMRLITMYFLPLEPPTSILLMEDPFVAFWGNGGTYTKDLFFSGHTATMVALTLTAKNKNLKILFAIGTIVVASLILAQHVHYTIDVLSAPFFVYTCYRIAILLNK